MAEFLWDDDPIGCSGTREGGTRVGGCDPARGAIRLTLSCKGAGGTGNSATRWEPGSARVPTFCAGPLGKASGDGDLPLDGEDGGEPKRESSSPSGFSWACDIALFRVYEVRTRQGKMGVVCSTSLECYRMGAAGTSVPLWRY